MKKLIATATMLGTGLYAFAFPVFAEAVIICPPNAGPLCTLTLGKVVTTGIQAILVIALVLAFIFLVFGGIKWIMSGGDKAGTEAAKGTITAALIGLVIVFLAWAFINLITGFFGVSQTWEIPTIK